MSTVVEIREAIRRLPPKEFCELMAEFVPERSDAWDREMKKDAAAGRFDRMNRDAAAEHAAGRTEEWP